MEYLKVGHLRSSMLSILSYEQRKTARFPGGSRYSSSIKSPEWLQPTFVPLATLQQKSWFHPH